MALPKVNFGGPANTQTSGTSLFSGDEVDASKMAEASAPRAFKKQLTLRSTMRHIDDRRSATSNENEVKRLFEMIDKNGDGHISPEEFHKIYDVMKESIHEEHIKEEALERSKYKANQRVRLLAFVSAGLILLIAVMSGINALLVYALLEATKEVKTGVNSTLTAAGSDAAVRVASVDSHHDAGRLVDSSSSAIVQTAPAMERVPMRIAPLLSVESLNQVSTVVVRRDSISSTGETYLEAYKIRTFRVYHALYMEFECVNGQTVYIDRGTVYIANSTAGERIYTCANNVECASFLAAGVDVVELGDQFELALDQYQRELRQDMAHLNISTAANGTNATTRRQLNYEGHTNPDGSGFACKVTANGIHKQIIGGMGTPTSPYIYANIKVNFAPPEWPPEVRAIFDVPVTNENYAANPGFMYAGCSLPDSNHRHYPGVPCGYGWVNARRERRRQLKNVDGSPLDLKEYVARRKLDVAEGRHLTDSVPIPFDADTEMVVCPEVVDAQVLEVGCQAAKAWCYQIFHRHGNDPYGGFRALCRGYGDYGTTGLAVSTSNAYPYTGHDCPSGLIQYAIDEHFNPNVHGPEHVWRTFGIRWYDRVGYQYDPNPLPPYGRRLEAGEEDSEGASRRELTHDMYTSVGTGLPGCTESCNWAFDADCDDGGVGAEYASCELGTDCTDCGTRLVTASAPPPPVSAQCNVACGDTTCGILSASRTCAQISSVGCSCSGCCSNFLPASSTYSYDPNSVTVAPVSSTSEMPGVDVAGTLCAKSLWDAYSQVFTGPIIRSFQQVAGFSMNLWWGPQRDAFVRNMATVAVSDLLSHFFYDDNEDIDINGDVAVAEGVFTIMQWYDECGHQCSRNQVLSMSRRRLSEAQDGPPRPPNYLTTKAWQVQSRQEQYASTSY